MSAFIVGHDHIDGLLTWAAAHGGLEYRLANAPAPVADAPVTAPALVPINAATATMLGRLLMAENERSVRARYPNDSEDDLPGIIGQRASNYTFKRFEEPLTAAMIVKACNCLSYQSYETDDYESTEAFKLLQEIREAAIRKAVGSAAVWELRRKNKERV